MFLRAYEISCRNIAEYFIADPCVMKGVTLQIIISDALKNLSRKKVENYASEPFGYLQMAQPFMALRWSRDLVFTAAGSATSYAQTPFSAKKAYCQSVTKFNRNCQSLIGH